MSFFSDLFEGNFSNLGSDLSNPFKDTVSSFESQPGWLQGLEGAGAAALGAFALPELLPAFAATDLGGVAAGGFGAASDAFDVAGGLGPGLAGTAFDTAGGVPLAGLDASAAGGTLSDTAISSALESPGASAFASTADSGAFGGTGTALGMGGGGDLDAAAAQGFPAGVPANITVGGGVTGVPGGAPSFAQDFTGSELLAGTGVGGGSPLGTFGAAPGAAGGGNVLTDTLSGIGNFLGSPAGKGATALAGLGGLGTTLWSGYRQKRALDAANQQQKQNVEQAANAQAAVMANVQPLLNNGSMLTTYLTNNTLPPQFQSQIDQWIKATKAQITQGYASRSPGDPGAADPMKNSALQQDLANVDQQALGLKANFENLLSTAGQNMIDTANKLVATGLNATQLESEIPIAVSRLNAALNAQMSQAISSFAAALNGGNRNIGGPGSLNISLNPQTGAFS